MTNKLPLLRRVWRLPGSLSGPTLGLIAVVLLFCALIGLKGDRDSLLNFLSFRNVQVIEHSVTVSAVVALGMLLIVISGGIDLSVGSVVALVTVVTMQVYRLVYLGAAIARPDGQATVLWAPTHSAALASLAAIPAGVLVGGLAGLINGTIVTRLRVSPFVTTLGMLSIARGLAYWISERRPIDFPRGGRPGWADAFATVYPGLTVLDAEFWTTWSAQPSMAALGLGVVRLVNPGFLTLLMLAAGVAVLLRWTVLGRYCYAIGSNEPAARMCGVAVERTKVILYVVAGLLTGWAGILMFAHGSSGDPGGGIGLELDVIAAVVIGGASLSGGRGTVLGTLLGVLILGVLINGVSQFNVPIEVRHILIGAIIIINTALSHWQRRK